VSLALEPAMKAQRWAQVLLHLARFRPPWETTRKQSRQTAWRLALALSPIRPTQYQWAASIVTGANIAVTGAISWQF